jgi:hypothetical protein
MWLVSSENNYVSGVIRAQKADNFRDWVEDYLTKGPHESMEDAVAKMANTITKKAMDVWDPDQETHTGEDTRTSRIFGLAFITKEIVVRHSRSAILRVIDDLMVDIRDGMIKEVDSIRGKNN